MRREGGRAGEREGGRVRERERGGKGEREREREEGRAGEREGGRERGRERVVRRDPTSPILVCSPSNSADEILYKLVSSPCALSSKIFRLDTSSRHYDDLNPGLLQYCFFQGETFQCPSLEALLRHSIIISTYVRSFQLYAGGIGSLSVLSRMCM